MVISFQYGGECTNNFEVETFKFSILVNLQTSENESRLQDYSELKLILFLLPEVRGITL